jgi:hypothetical protein
VHGLIRNPTNDPPGHIGAASDFVEKAKGDKDRFITIAALDIVMCLVTENLEPNNLLFSRKLDFEVVYLPAEIAIIYFLKVMIFVG